MPYYFRPATNEDRDDVKRLIFTILAEYDLIPDPAGTDSDLQAITSVYTEAGGAFDLLVDDAGQLIGSVAIFRQSEFVCELRKMYLYHSARGNGLGRCLLDHALRRAAELGFRKIFLETASVLKHAIALYESYGFRPCVNDHLSSRCDIAYFLDLAKR